MKLLKNSIIKATLIIGLLFCICYPTKAQTVDSLSHSYSSPILSVYIQTSHHSGSKWDAISFLNYNDTLKLNVCIKRYGSTSPSALDTTLQITMSASQIPNYYVAYVHTLFGVNGGIPCTNLVSTYPPLATGLDEKLSSKNIKIYPNPTQNILNLEVENNVDISAITLYDMIGRAIKAFNPNQRKLHLSHFDNGQYFLKIETENSVVTKKVMLE